jgi:hypothetical protein
MNIAKTIEHGNGIIEEVYENGGIKWYKDGVLHKDNGPAMLWDGGYEAWYKNGFAHREDGPAIIYPGGRKCWYKNGKKHREDGPAYEKPNGYKEWWIEDKQLTEKEFNSLLLNKELSEDLEINQNIIKKPKI